MDVGMTVEEAREFQRVYEAGQGGPGDDTTRIAIRQTRRPGLHGEDPPPNEEWIPLSAALDLARLIGLDRSLPTLSRYADQGKFRSRKRQGGKVQCEVEFTSFAAWLVREVSKEKSELN
jgi:hypothetical protein